MLNLNDVFSKKNDKSKIGNVGSNLQPYLLKELYQQIADRDILFITKDRLEGQRILNTLEFLIGQEVLFFPEWDTAPYEHIAPSQTLLHQRMRALFGIVHRSEPKFVVTTIQAALQQIPSKTNLKASVMTLRLSEVINRDKLINRLVDLGYSRVASVITLGEFAIRGSIVDISAEKPGYGYRIDFFGDKIESIKLFDIASQISSEPHKLIHIFCPSELIVSQEDITGDIFEYLKKPVVILDNFIRTLLSKFLDKVQSLYQADSALSSDRIWLGQDELEAKLKAHNVIEFSPFKSYINTDIAPVPSFHGQGSSFEKLKTFIADQQLLTRQVIISCLSEGSRDRLTKILNDHEIVAAKIIVSPIEYGAVCQDHVIVTEEDLLGEKVKAAKSRKKVSGEVSLLDQIFQIGDLVVHKEYGVGRFEGLELVKLSNTQHDCLKVLYAKEDKLFVPVENMDVLFRYGSASETMALDSLDKASWQLRKAKAKNKIKEIAAYLLEIAAQRNLEEADRIAFNKAAYDEFCTKFPYVETEDQEEAITAVLSDLAGGKPMDRLICGDTGVGKTEVAIRAAFAVTQAKNQRLVVLICPTTLLCRQHYKVFKERFKGLDIKIAQLSRLVSLKERKIVMQEISESKVDILIGTHALLTEKIDYKDLSLLIIDEEHHFGVSHKERLKKLKKNIHVLTLSATPIPRTLQMSLAGIREMNLISTPPMNRIPTKISVMGFDLTIVKEALLREKSRGGQSFYICPRISDINDVEATLKSILPSFKIVSAHGRLTADALDDIMEEFYEGKFDILLATQIIESGLDIPKANTIIIHDSDKFGLAQAYQLKGRVGRSNVESYAYFTYRENKILLQHTVKKLQILQDLDELGAGFSIASYDMDIRGFGNLLGEEQSGHIKEIGVELYQKMLEETLVELKAKEANFEVNMALLPQINIDMPILIPESYIPEFSLRLSLYKRASTISTENELIAFAAECVNRFGPIPKELEGLLSVIRLKQLCLEAFVTKINLGDKGILIEFADNKDPKIETKLFEFVMKNKDKVKVKTSNSIILIVEIHDQEKRIRFAKKFLESICRGN